MGCFAALRRFLFFAALVTQAAMLAQYPSIYWENKVYNLLILLAVPTLLAWFAVLKMYDGSEQLQSLWIVWGTYVVSLLIPMVCVTYGPLREHLDRKEFFGPTVLMMITCGSPGIALLLLTTAKDASEDINLELFTQLCGNIVLDLFDDIEILDMLLSQNEKFDLSSRLETSIIVFVCFSLLLSTLEMAEKKCDESEIKNRKIVYGFRLVFQMLLVNVALLVIRLIVWLKYKHNASIFIAKNFIVIVISIICILRHIPRCCCYQPKNTQSERETEISKETLASLPCQSSANG